MNLWCLDTFVPGYRCVFVELIESLGNGVLHRKMNFWEKWQAAGVFGLAEKYFD